MAVIGSLGFILSDIISFNLVYLCLSGFMVVGIITTLISDEGDIIIKSKESLIEPFIEFFRKNKAFIILTFIFIYKIGDMLAFFYECTLLPGFRNTLNLKLDI